MNDLFHKYEKIMKQIIELENTEQVKKYLKKIDERTEILEVIRDKAVESEENFELPDCTVTIQRRIKISYNEELLKKELPNKFDSYLIFDNKAAASDPELNDYAITEEKVYTVLRKRNDG